MTDADRHAVANLITIVWGWGATALFLVFFGVCLGSLFYVMWKARK